MNLERRDFLVEIGTEELPPRALPVLQQAFVAAIGAGLDKAGLAHGTVVGFATPRRLAVRVRRLASQQPEQHVKRRGPPVSAGLNSAARSWLRGASRSMSSSSIFCFASSVARS